MSNAATICAVVVACAACGGTNATLERNDVRIAKPARYDATVLESIFDAMLHAMGPNLEREGQILRQATRGERALYALWTVDGEVNNGGFEQFFVNTSGALTQEAIRGAREIGARRHERILRAAVAPFQRGVPKDRAARQRALDEIPDATKESTFGTLDDEWYAADRELERRLIAYVRTHPREFFR